MAACGLGGRRSPTGPGGVDGKGPVQRLQGTGPGAPGVGSPFRVLVRHSRRLQACAQHLDGLGVPQHRLRQARNVGQLRAQLLVKHLRMGTRLSVPDTIMAPRLPLLLW